MKNKISLPRRRLLVEYVEHMADRQTLALLLSATQQNTGSVLCLQRENNCFNKSTYPELALLK